MNDAPREELDLSGWLRPLEETVDRLWSEILLHAGDRRRLVFTGVAAGDGVTTVAAAAALGLARNLRRRTLLIEANLHAPSLAAALRTGGPGFAEICRGEIPIPQAIRSTDTPLLHVIAAGESATSPGLLAEKGVADLFDGLGRVYDRIVIDAAPILARPETLLLVRGGDAAVLVARAHRSRSAQVREAAARIRASGTPLIGTVLNQVRRRTPRWLEPKPATRVPAGLGES